MKRFAKIILFGLGGIVLVLIIALIGINLYLQSSDVQQRIRLATEKAIGSPVAVKRTLFTPWSGLVLSGLSIPDPMLEGVNMIEAPSFAVRFQVLPLLQKRFVITEIALDAPVIALRQDEKGKWVVRRERPSRPVDKPDRPTADKPGRKAVPYEVQLQRFTIRNGTGVFMDHKGRFLARFDGLKVEGKLTPAGMVSGDLWIEKMEIARQLYPQRLRAHFEQQGTHLAVTDVKAALAGGRMRADFHLTASSQGAPPEFTFKGELEDVSIPKLILEAHGDDAGSEGTLAGSVNLEGDPTNDRSITGEGLFSLSQARIKPLDFIRQIGSILRIDELQMLDLQRADLRLQVRDRAVWLNDLTLETENLMITGRGPIRFDGKLDLDGRLLINEHLQKQLAGIIGDNFQPSENADYKQVEFSVTGRANRPKTDLVEKVTGIKVPNVGGLLRGLFQAAEPSGTDGQ